MFLQENKILKFLSFMWNPLSWVMEAAALMAIILANGGVSREHNNCSSNILYAPVFSFNIYFLVCISFLDSLF